VDEPEGASFPASLPATEAAGGLGHRRRCSSYRAAWRCAGQRAAQCGVSCWRSSGSEHRRTASCNDARFVIASGSEGRRDRRSSPRDRCRHHWALQVRLAAEDLVSLSVGDGRAGGERLCSLLELDLSLARNRTGARRPSMTRRGRHRRAGDRRQSLPARPSLPGRLGTGRARRTTQAHNRPAACLRQGRDELQPHGWVVSLTGWARPQLRHGRNQDRATMGAA
jgi:hypothetical protein